MWRKPFKAQKSNLIKSSDKRKLKEKLASSFPSLSREALDDFLPNKEDIYLLKINGSRTLIYTNKDNEPLFFDLDGREHYYPSVYALWKLPHFLPVFEIHPATFRFVSRGADLMLPGVIVPPEGLGPLTNNQLRVIQFIGTKTPIALGLSAATTDQIQKNGMKGKACQIIHFYLDYLWRSGSRTNPTIELAAGISAEDDILDDESLPTTKDGAEQAVALESTSPETTALTASAAAASAAPDPSENPPAVDQPSSAGETPTETAATSTDASQGANEEGEEGSKGPEITPEEMDARIWGTFFQAIKRRLKDNQLPMLASAFHANVFLPCRPINTEINWKRSSFKKFSVFLYHMDRQENVCGISEEKPGIIMIDSINREHPSYLAFKTLPISATHEAESTESAEAAAATVKEAPFEIREFFALPKGLLWILPDDFEGKNDFTSPDCVAFLWAYVAQEKLTLDNQPANVQLNPRLAQALWPKSTPPDVVTKAELARKFKDMLLPMHEITIDGDTSVKKGEVSKVTIKGEQRQGRKWVTKILGLYVFGIDAKEVARVCQKKFAASATTNVVPVRGASKSVEVLEVIIQGSFESKIPELLSTEFSLPAKYIDGGK